MLWRRKLTHFLKLQNFFALLCPLLFALFSLTPFSHAEEGAVVFRGSIPISRGSLNRVELSPDVQVFPGETVTVTIGGSANVNQHNFSVRRCKYFGLKCWNEDRTHTNIRPAQSFEIEVALDLKDTSGGYLVRKTIDEGSAVDLEYPLDLGIRLENGVNILAFIKSYNNGTTIDRRSCHNRPEHCSSGSLSLTIGATEITKRFNTIVNEFDSFRPENVPAERIRSRNYIDQILINGQQRAEKMQGLLANKLVEWVQNGDERSQSKLVQLIQYALQLAANRDHLDKLSQARLDAYMKIGAFENLENEAHDLINNIYGRCSDGDNCDLKDARKLGEALRALSVAQAEKRARIQTSDITLAVATLARATEILEAAMDKEKLMELEADLELLSNLHQDNANKLMLIRTPAEISKAILYMEQSVCLQELSADANEADSNRVFLKEECRSLPN